jgi:hypothetical protein
MHTSMLALNRSATVAEVALGGGRHAHERRHAGEVRDVAGFDVRAVHHRRRVRQRAALEQQLDGGHAVLEAALVELFALLARVHVQRHGVLRGVQRECFEPIARARAHRVRRHADRHVGGVLHELAHSVDVREERVVRRKREPALNLGQRLVHAAARIAGLEEHEANAHVGRRARERERHLGLRVRAAVDVVVQIVELAHSGEACAQHVRVTPRREHLDVVGADARRIGVHGVSP